MMFSHFQFRVIQVPTGQKYISLEGLNKEDANSIVVNYYQGSPFSMKDSVIIDIIMVRFGTLT